MLDIRAPFNLNEKKFKYSGARQGRKREDGAKNRRGPAAVSGDERRKRPLFRMSEMGRCGH